MPTGDPICHICGQYLSLHIDRIPCKISSMTHHTYNRESTINTLLKYAPKELIQQIQDFTFTLLDPDKNYDNNEMMNIQHIINRTNHFLNEI